MNMNTVYSNYYNKRLLFIGKSPIIPDLISYFAIGHYFSCESRDFKKISKKRGSNQIVACIGSPRSYLKKHRVISKIESNFINGDYWVNLIEEKHIDCIYGCGNIVMENCFISKTCVINNHNLLINNVSVHHGCEIGNCVTLASGVVLCGDVRIGSNIFIGTNSVVKEHVKICDNVLIGANSFVNKNIVESGTYVGTPVRKIK